MTTVVEISDSEDSEDCVLDSVIYVEDKSKENYSELYHEVCQENKHLAEFIEMCLRLENSKDMLETLKKNLLHLYYAADKSARESSKIQKNLRRANHLLRTDPGQKFTHIKDLCNIFRSLKVKKKVPFVTLTTNLEECTNPTGLNNVIELNDTLNESACSQQSTAEEQNELVVETKNIQNKNADCTISNRIKAIENKITYYKRRIAVLDQLEVDNDSVNSPYITCDRLKNKIVSLYKELCQLIGSQPVKRMGIRLKLAEGHPPGPTRTLEKFLNKKLNKDGDPPFPDFCDVITCVTEANEKENLGWTKSQIMQEASSLFTQCGRALQKRRQKREYCDLLHRVNMEDFEMDPADKDPALRAVLEENKRIATKKENDLLERYTTMQYAAPKTKIKKCDTDNENTEEEIVTKDNTDVMQQDVISDNINMEGNEQKDHDGNKGNYDNIALKHIDGNIINSLKSNDDTNSKQNEDGILSYDNSVRLDNCMPKVNSDIVKRVPDALPVNNGDIEMHIPEQCDNIQDINIKPNNDKVNNSASEIVGEELLKHQLKQNPDMYNNSLAGNFTVTIEIMSDG